jgi:hypothetical protein
LPSTPKKHNIIGTPKYASFHVHEGEEYSRRDDLMSMVYVGLFLCYGAGLWSNMKSQITVNYTGEKSDILHPTNQWFKSQKHPQNILNMTNGWSQLGGFAEKVYKLSFQERPSYKEYIDLFSKTI